MISSIYSPGLVRVDKKVYYLAVVNIFNASFLQATQLLISHMPYYWEIWPWLIVRLTAVNHLILISYLQKVTYGWTVLSQFKYM